MDRKALILLASAAIVIVPRFYGEDISVKEDGVNSAVKRKENKVWIEGVPVLSWDSSPSCTFVGAMEAAMKVTPRPVKQAELMGVSGLAFRTRWYQKTGAPGWCPSSPVGELPEEMSAIRKATGWQIRCVCLLGQKDMNMARFAPDIVASIDAGLPVPAYGADLNVGVVYGYADRGKTLLMRDYSAGATPLEIPVEKLGAQAHFLSGPKDALPPREAAIQAMRIAVANWKRKPVSAAQGAYRYGEDALVAWAEDIGKADTFNDEQRKSLFFVDWWCFSSLNDARRTAAEFLTDSAELFTGEARAHVLRAAEAYRQEREMLRARGKEGAFFGPWTGKSVKDWTAEVRRREQDPLAEARRMESTAIAEIEKALVSAGEERPSR